MQQIMEFMEIDKKLHNEIKEYCKLNNLKMTEYVNKLLRQAFNIDKFGVSPFNHTNIENVNEKPPLTHEEVVEKKDTSVNEKKEKEVAEIEESVILDNGIQFNKIKKNKRKLK